MEGAAARRSRARAGALPIAMPCFGRDLACALILSLALVMAPAAGLAQQATRLAQKAEPSIEVPPTYLTGPASQIALSIQLGSPESIPTSSFLRIRGLPPTVSLSDGHAIGPGSWAVPLYSLPTLKAIVPAAVTGRAEVVIQLVATLATRWC